MNLGGSNSAHKMPHYHLRWARVHMGRSTGLGTSVSDGASYTREPMGSSMEKLCSYVESGALGSEKFLGHFKYWNLQSQHKIKMLSFMTAFSICLGFKILINPCMRQVKHIIAIIVNFIFKIFKLTYSKFNLEVLVYGSMSFNIYEFKSLTLQSQ